MIGNLRVMTRAYVEVLACWYFEIELPIIKQSKFELAADLGWVRHVEEEVNSAVPMGPTPIFR